MAFHFEALVKELEGGRYVARRSAPEGEASFRQPRQRRRAHPLAAAFAWESVVHDLRYAFRILKKNRILTAVVVISLALGIGANVAIFTVMNAVMLRMLPVREPERLVLLTSAVKAGFFPEDYVHDYEGSSHVDEKTQMNVGSSVSTQTYETIKKESTVLEQTFAFAANDRRGKCRTGRKSRARDGAGSLGEFLRWAWGGAGAWPRNGSL